MDPAAGSTNSEQAPLAGLKPWERRREEDKSADGSEVKITRTKLTHYPNTEKRADGLWYDTTTGVCLSGAEQVKKMITVMNQRAEAAQRPALAMKARRTKRPVGRQGLGKVETQKHAKQEVVLDYLRQWNVVGHHRQRDVHTCLLAILKALHAQSQTTDEAAREIGEYERMLAELNATLDSL